MAANKTKKKATAQQGQTPSAAASKGADSSKLAKAQPSDSKSSKAADKDAKAAEKAKADKAKAKEKAKKNGGKPGFVDRTKTYFKGVRSEVKRVVWPTKDELVKYTGAVVAMLVFFGVLIAVADAIIVPALYAFSGLR